MELKKLVLFIIGISSVLSMDIIHFIKEPKDTIVPKDGAVKILCIVNKSDVKYSWLMYNEQSRSEQPVIQNQYISVDINGVLIMKQHSSIVGRYRCKAVIANAGTIVSQLFRVDVADMYINKVPLTQLGGGQYRIGSRAMLICQFWTVPQSEAEYRWYMKGRDGKRQIQPSTSVIFHYNGKLLEFEVTDQSYGSYYCEALYAKYGMERSSSDIDVAPMDNINAQKSTDQLIWVAKPTESLLLDRGQLYSRQIKLIKGINTLINREGTDRLELVCAANIDSDKNRVDISWLKDGILLDRVAPHHDRFNYEIIGQGSLVLLNTTQEHNGVYTCKASVPNKDKQIQTLVKLIVKPHLRFISKPAPIVIGDLNKEILLSCRLNDAETRTSIAWRKNGEVMPSNSYLQPNDGFMRISRLLDSDEGIFQCLADDEFSSLQALVQMKIYKPPSRAIPDNRPLPVMNLRVRAVSYRTLNISWNHATEGFESILHYEITLLDLSDLSQNNHKITLKADRLESSVLVKDLTPDSFHRIYVSAVNGSGTSYPAVIKSSPRVLSKAPSAAPTKVIASDIGSGVVTIQWTSPPTESIHGELLGYRVVVISVDSIYSKSIDVNKNTQMLQLSDLIPDTKYSIRIQALTRGGRGPLSDTVTFDTRRSNNKHDVNFRPMRTHRLNKDDRQLFKDNLHQQPPGEINHWIAKGLNNSIVLQWSHPTTGGQIKRYKIIWGKVYPGPAEFTVQYPTSSYVIENLEVKTQYMIKIIPVNDAGDGKELLFSQYTGSVDISNIVLTTLLNIDTSFPEKIPIPLNLRIKNIGMDSVIISWEDPSNDLSNTRLYQIRYNALEKVAHSTLFKNTTETSVQIIDLQSSTSYAFSVRTGDVVPPRDGEYVSKDWTWSEWSLKESFNTIGEKPQNSPGDFSMVTLGKPDVRDNDVYTKVMVSWSLPVTKSGQTHDEIVGYTIFFTDTPKVDRESWHTQILPKTQFSSEVSISGRSKVYYFRIGCRTTNFQCPLSKILVYKTADAHGLNYGLLQIPEKYEYVVDIPEQYLNGNPVDALKSTKHEPQVSFTHDFMWLIIGIIFGSLVFMLMLVVVICICCRRRSKSQFDGYKPGTKSSNQRIGGGSGLLLSNQSPAISNGKVSPHFMPGFGQQLKTPDLFAHSEPHFGDLESDSNQDNDSLRFASVSQHHLASATTCANVFNPAIQNHSLMRSHPQMTFYPDMAGHNKSSINSTAIMTIPGQVNDSSLQRMHQQQHNVMYPFSAHPFTQHLVNTGSPMPICSSSCMQPMHLSPQMLATQSHDAHSTTNYSNTPRVNASELASHTSSVDSIDRCHINTSQTGYPNISYSDSSTCYNVNFIINSCPSPEDIRPLMHHSSRVSDSEISQYYGSAANSTVKSHKTKIDNSSAKKTNGDSQKSSQVSKKGVVERESLDNDVTKGFSTEELSQEMANLEGLMKDLNAITQKEFEFPDSYRD